MAFSKDSTPLILFFFFFFLLLALPSSARNTPKIKNPKPKKPCKTLLLYFHDIVYNGHNRDNATSFIVAARQGSNLTTLDRQFYFGNVVVFDDPITLDDDLGSDPVGRARGMYVYDSKSVYSAFLGFSFVIDGRDRRGTINFVGADLMMQRTRDVSVVGGTGDYFMHQGIATLMTDAVEGEVYFRLRVDIKFYQCW